jgi:hypothetical protein
MILDGNWHPDILAWLSAPGFRPLNHGEKIRTTDEFWSFGNTIDTNRGEPPMKIAIGRSYDGSIPARRHTT